MDTKDKAPWYEKYKVDVPERKLGGWRVERFVVPEEMNIARMRYAWSGRGVEPGTYTRLMKEGAYDPMMSDTPAEIRDHREALHHIGCADTKRVLINGLGIGVILQWALQQSHVEHVDVTEIDPWVIALVKPHYVAMAEALGKELSIIECDAFMVEWPVGTKWDVAWHDIWPGICTDNLPEMTKLNRKYARRVKWQGCWSQDDCRRQQRRDRNNYWG